MSQKNDSTSEKSAPLFGECPKPVTRRKFMGAMTAMGAAALTNSLAAERKEEKTKPPVWSGTLQSAVKPAAGRGSKHALSGLNVIVIIADTFRADHLGCYGSTRVKTPYLDKLAQESVLFTDVTTEGLPTIP